MDEPLLTRPIVERVNTPQLKGKTTQKPQPFSPLITTSRANSITNLIIKFHKSNSAPALFTDETGTIQPDFLNPRTRNRSTSSRIIPLALLGLLFYLLIGITVFLFTSRMFKGQHTHKLIDALYFTVVTLCTIGYGGLVPATIFTKLFTSLFILVGFGFIGVLRNGLVIYVLDKQEQVLLGTVYQNQFNKRAKTYVHFIDTEKGRMRIRIKVCLALGVVIICLGMGTITAHFIEDLNWVDSFYLSVTSVTTVGYGDYAFKTVSGRCFAIVWLLASTLAVARAFLYLTEFRIEKRNQRIATEILHRKLTLGDLVRADMNHNGSISKAEYVIFKLKEMGKIVEKDVIQICKQFDTLKVACNGKITISDLMEGDTNDLHNT